MSSNHALKLVCVDTSTFTESIALVEGTQLIAEKQVYRHRGHASGLHHDLRELLKDHEWHLNDLDGLVCGIGPGSFTGMRVGLSACKGLAYALDKPLYAVATPLALLSAVANPDAYALIDARRGEIYVQGQGMGPPRCWTLDTLLDYWQQHNITPRILIGEAALKYAEALQSYFPHVIIPSQSAFHSPRAAFLAAHISEPAHIDDLQPIYVRASDAEINYPDGFPSEARLFK